MNTAEQILVVILSVALAVLLVLAIVATIHIIRLVKMLETIALKARDFVDSAEAVAEMARSTVSQFTLLKFVHGIVNMVMKRKK
ncbi:MAG TPA: hypothetical protein VJ836_03280 [Candidatus Saccharimonadales bacterium]|nr:hypothetical protein [Candidatus Saccharimonadales bacterium]